MANKINPSHKLHEKRGGWNETAWQVWGGIFGDKHSLFGTRCRLHSTTSMRSWVFFYLFVWMQRYSIFNLIHISGGIRRNKRVPVLKTKLLFSFKEILDSASMSFLHFKTKSFICTSLLSANYTLIHSIPCDFSWESTDFRTNIYNFRPCSDRCCCLIRRTTA